MMSLDRVFGLLLTRTAAVAVTAIVLLVAYRVVVGLIGRLLAPREGETETSPRLQRLRTFASLLTNIARWLVAFVALVIVMRELGVDVQAIVVSAGVVGLAAGFGAQSLIKDVITGMFLLFEGLIAVGDVIEVNAHTGTIEAIGLRVTRLRAQDGSLRIVPNGQLSEFTNWSRGWARAIVDVTVPREVPVEQALAVLGRVGEEWADATGSALEPARAQGIIKFSGGEMVLRLMAKVDPARRLDAEFELRRRVKHAFDQERWPTAGAP